MAKIDDTFLEELGLSSVPQDEKNKMLVHIQQILQDRIGTIAEKTLSEEKRDELDRLATGPDCPSSIAPWLEINLPGYQAIVEEEVRKIREEIKPQVASIVQNPANSAPPTSL